VRRPERPRRLQQGRGILHSSDRPPTREPGLCRCWSRRRAYRRGSPREHPGPSGRGRPASADRWPRSRPALVSSVLVVTMYWSREPLHDPADPARGVRPVPGRALSSAHVQDRDTGRPRTRGQPGARRVESSGRQLSVLVERLEGPRRVANSTHLYLAAERVHGHQAVVAADGRGTARGVAGLRNQPTPDNGVGQWPGW